MEFPCYMYHKEKGAVLFRDEESFKAAGSGFVDSPAKLKDEKENKKISAKAKK